MSLSNTEINPDELKFYCPATLVIAGTSQSGKTVLMNRILIERNSVFAKNNMPTKIIFFYKIWQCSYTVLQKQIGTDIQFIQGFNGLSSLEMAGIMDRNDNDRYIICAFDDLITDLLNSKAALDLFTVYVHHLNLFCIVTTQHLYLDSKLRALMIQSNYLIIFDHPKMRQAIHTLSSQIFRKPRILADCLNSLEPYRFLIIDMRPNTRKFLLLRSGLPFHENEKIICFSIRDE